jgi:RNA polymerase subunit RPABC4/transcription elongation factor Spt4
VHLTTARLCLNCEEVHDAQGCPLCASETFAYLTRWVPHLQSEHRSIARTRLAPTVLHRAAVGGVATGLTAFGLYQWFKRAQTRVELAMGDVGELR